jgi:segregation and condensation protein B
MTDETKETSNEESQTDVEQSAASEANNDVVSEASSGEPEPVQQEAESMDEGDAVPDSTETSAEGEPEETTAESSEEEQTPTPAVSEATTTETPIREDETVPQPAMPQAETSEQEPAPQTGAALVEMLDAGQPQDSEQPTEGAEVSAPATLGLEPPASDESPTVESVIEAILFATDEPLPEGKLAGIVETTGKQVRDCIESLNARYEANHNAFRIEQIAGGYQMLTQPIYNSWLKKMLRVRSDNKLSPAAMETLAIIAYKQPVIRADIEAVRGVAVGEVIRSLMYKGLVKIAGRAEILGRPMLYGTTKKFLEIFGLNSIKDLPKAEDLKNPDRG